MSPLTWPPGARLDAPAQGDVQQLMLLLLASGQPADLLAPLAVALRGAFAQAAIVTLAPTGDLAQAAAAVGAVQSALGVRPEGTALFGFALGAQVALALAHRHDGIAGRVVAFAADYALPPSDAPQRTTLHWLHGGADDVVPAARAAVLLQHLADLGADATLDVAQGVGHEPAPVLIAEALRRLTSHIPARTWREALGAGGA